MNDENEAEMDSRESAPKAEDAEPRAPEEAAANDQAVDSVAPHDDARLAERFLAWLRAARDEAERIESAEAAHADSHAHDAEHGATCEHESVGLYRLVEEFTALRQEIKLQAKGARGLEDAVASLLPRVKEHLERAESGPRPTSDAGATALQPLVVALAELDDALERGRRQMERAAAELLAPEPSKRARPAREPGDPRGELRAAIDAAFGRQSALARWASRGFYADVLRACDAAYGAASGDGGGEERGTTSASDGRRSQLVAALLDGYVLIQQRLARQMAKEELVRIPTERRPVDPEQMVVVEAVEATDDAPAGWVVEEVRRGYAWRGKVLRCAEVKAARGS